MNTPADRILVLGGARSGKSTFAESLAAESGRSLVYLATGQARDGEMSERIDHHRQRRGAEWSTVEEPLDLSAALRRHARDDRVILIDCLTLWVTNLMMAGEDVAECGQRFCDDIADLQGMLIFVSNEVGLGIVPDNAMARAFRDHAGRLHQRLAACCDQVFFVAAGLPMRMKG